MSKNTAMKKLIPYIPKVVSYFFILLFCYAAISKALDFENFHVQIGQSPLLSAYAGFVSYFVIILELLIVVLLTIPKTNLLGLYASTSLMTAFTIYIYLILNYSDFVPCSCGGILEKLGWTEHLIFNILCIILGILVIVLQENLFLRPFKRTLFMLTFSNVLSASLIVSLFLSSEYIIKKENNFTRRFLLHPIVDEKVFDLGLNSYYFAGSESNKLFLGNLTTPLLCTIIDKSTGLTTELKFSLDKKDFDFKNLQLKIDQDHAFFYDGSIPIIYKATLRQTLARTISYQDAYFNQLSVIDSSNFGLRTQIRQSQEYELANLDLNRKNKILIKPDLLEKQIDGVFDVDGQLIKNSYNNSFAYVYTYRNQFLIMDSTFEPYKKGKTIDTTRVAKLNISKLSDGRHKITSPAIRTNRATAFHRNILFVESALRGKGESLTAWNNSYVIDLYRSDKNEYTGSFYIPKRKGEPMRQIIADDNYLFILSDNYLIRYKFTEQIKKIYRSGEAENL
ncbi:MauE/DoxX family redox-associated membrane protein [Chryseobacterium sp. NKUCC03_KSP]|uniref:MauE/DoxX family redox-associated membrane protein n=1 Tax=Chryseobacterium sp. NKUCC03_KSP TaxID=2842125 RepID=UPI00214B9F4C|nr:MauE/DoxX family redox-associated membrane protein [Chryseobacterium sp. NKUCC03_KSP]